MSDVTVRINKKLQQAAKDLGTSIKMYDDDEVIKLVTSTIEARMKQQLKNKGMKARLKELEAIVSRASKEKSATDMLNTLHQ